MIVASLVFSFGEELSFFPQPFLVLYNIDENHIIYRMMIIILACFAVAVLSGILSRQMKGTKQDLKRVQEHLGMDNACHLKISDRRAAR